MHFNLRYIIRAFDAKRSGMPHPVPWPAPTGGNGSLPPRCSGFLRRRVPSYLNIGILPLLNVLAIFRASKNCLSN